MDARRADGAQRRAGLLRRARGRRVGRRLAAAPRRSPAATTCARSGAPRSAGRVGCSATGWCSPPTCSPSGGGRATSPRTWRCRSTCCSTASGALRPRRPGAGGDARRARRLGEPAPAVGGRPHPGAQSAFPRLVARRRGRPEGQPPRRRSTRPPTSPCRRCRCWSPRRWPPARWPRRRLSCSRRAAVGAGSSRSTSSPPQRSPGTCVAGLRSVDAPASTYRALASAPRLVLWKVGLWLRVVGDDSAVEWTRTGTQRRRPDRIRSLARDRARAGARHPDRPGRHGRRRRRDRTARRPRPRAGAAHQVVTVNADFVVNALGDPAVHRLLRDADLGLGRRHAPGRRRPDPRPADARSGSPAPTSCPRSPSGRCDTGLRIHFYGSAPGVAEQAVDLLVERYPGAHVTADSGG